MKPVVLLPPLVALLAVTSWIGAERHSISSLESERATLRKAITVREAEISAEGAGETPDEAEKARNADEPIDWKAVAAMAMEKRNGEAGDMRAAMRLQRRLLDMTGAQLAAALDEIATLDLPADARARLEGMLMGPLISKDPEMALNRFIDQVSDERSTARWQLSGALQQWARKDPTAAVTWMDRAIAAGKFDSKSLDGESRSRVQFETSLVIAMLATDAAGAGKRVAALPEDERNQILSRAFSENEDTHAAYATLVREQAPQEEEAAIIGNQAGSLANADGFSRVDKFLETISATPAERAATAARAGETQVRQIAQKREIAATDIDTMREWVGKTAPDSVAEITGKALIAVSDNDGKNTFAHTADLALQYHASSGDDKILTTFLSNGNLGNNKEEARAVAEKINDPDLRAKVLENLK